MTVNADGTLGGTGTAGGGLLWDTGSLYATGTLTVIPEPATLAWLIAALGALMAGRRLSTGRGTRVD